MRQVFPTSRCCVVWSSSPSSDTNGARSSST